MPRDGDARSDGARKLRPATPADIPRVVELWREMWDLHEKLDPAPYVATPAAEQVIQGWIEENLRGERSAVFVAEVDGAVAGYVLCLILENPPVVPNQFFGFVSEIAVTERRRGQGIGKKLLDAAREWFRSKRISVVELNVSAKNPRAVRFWRNEGFSDYLLRLRTEL